MTTHSVRQRSRCIDFTPPSRTGGARSIGVPLAGAVRRSELTARPRRARPARVASVALLALVAAGVLAATVTNDAPAPSPLPLAAATMNVLPGFADAPATAHVPARAPRPTFFFADADDALSERAAVRATAHGEFGRNIAQGTAGATTPAPETVTAPPSVTAAVRASPVALAGPAPLVSPSPALAAIGERSAPPGSTELEVAVGPGDTLSGILNEHGVRMEQMSSLLADETVVRHLSRLSVGQTFTITRSPNGDFHGLSARIGNDTRVSVRRADESGFAVAAIDLPVEKERVVTSGTIEQSLYLAAEQANLKQSTIMTLADIFQWELDFARDIRKGDHFAIVYDRLYREGRYIGDGDILAAEFERGGRTHRAIRFVADDGTAGYYSPDGTSKRRTFTRHPVDVVRITSKFDPNRLHPVLHQIRAHRGVDYGAPHGSPIRATADGVVRFSGTRGAYGSTVILQHGERVKTLYAHMSRISDKSVVGHRVRQGDVIGYVGNTGRVTGTHLHYEFRVDEKHVDPLTVELPAAAPIAQKHRDALRAVADELVAQMRSVRPGDTETAAASTDAPDPSLAALDALADDVTGRRTPTSLKR